MKRGEHRTWGALLWALRLLGRDGWWLAATAACAAVALCAQVGLVATAAHLISRAALVDATVTLAVAITAVRFFAVCRVVFRYLERHVGHVAAFRAVGRGRVAMFRALEPLAPAGLVDRRGGDLLAAVVDDVDALQDLYLRVLVPPAAAVVTGVVAASVLGAVAGVLGVVLAAFLVAGAVVPPALARRRAASETAVTANAELQGAAVEVLDGLEELVVWDRRDLVVGALAEPTATAQRATASLARGRGASVAAASLLAGGAATVLLAMAALLVQRGELDGVALAMVPLIALAAFEAVTPLAAVPEHAGRTSAATGRLLELVDRGRSLTEPGPPSQDALPEATSIESRAPLLEAQHLSFAHRAGETVLHDVSLRLDPGEVLVVSGPSGAGKSTLVWLLARLTDPDAGRLHLAGMDIDEVAPELTRRQVAVALQHDHLFDTTVRDNLLVADADAADHELWWALRTVGLAAAVQARAGGLDAPTGADGERLSGGERQRLLVARAVLARRPVLVLDEPTVHLDARAAARLLRGVRAAQRHGALVIVTHDPDVAEPGDHRLHLPRPGRAEPTLGGEDGQEYRRLASR